ncbi:carbohydrate esterase family 4 protein [Annulohypoxylon maeteangense]|uniref:carbohydrate esterase family 4 protein n=1 Tax=Annulohypoxylon maeteangense TaxID=1927788 RepID=UPI0020076A24|nr:carbohydrate esterase family 4 protein [Annulohypoxylon maeteangense]KAI0880806.1 carbohydrate esterase family 4 protein [Annulohypoxylon maeteangense]
MPLFDLPRGHVGDLEYGVPIFTCRNPGQIALTFEDGPSQYTQDILDLLDHYDFKGTFFMTGTNTSVAPAARHTHIDDEETGWPALLSRIHETGHQFASHTYTRARLDGISSQGVAEEMVYNEMAFRNAIGLIPAYMRPPFDVWRDPAVREQLDGLGYHIILHDIDTRDYENDGENTIQKSVEIFNNAIRFDGNGSYIVRMQDTRQWTAMKLLPAVLESMEVRGYKGVTVGQCLDDAFFYWYRQPEA